MGEPRVERDKTIGCRACGADGVLLGDRQDIAVYRCRTCRFVFGLPSEPMGLDDAYRNYYRGLPPPPPDYRYEEFLSQAERRVGVGRFLEIGAGGGAFVRVAVRRGWRADATEVSETGLERLRTTGAKVFPGVLEDAGYGDNQFDFVASLEVLEHLPNPAGHLREVWRVTRDSGILLLTTPNFNGLSRRLLGMRWRVIDPEHLCYFTPKTVARMLQQAGFRKVSLTSRSLDVSTWGSSLRKASVPRFDPHGSARLRDAVQSRRALRAAKGLANLLLNATSLGDSLTVWAEK
jgi:SAM-dependent methyltransferase